MGVQGGEVSAHTRKALGLLLARLSSVLYGVWEATEIRRSRLGRLVWVKGRPSACDKG